MKVTIDKNTKVSILKHKNNTVYSHCGDLPESCLEHIASMKIPSNYAIQVYPSDVPDSYEIIIAVPMWMRGSGDAIAKKAQQIIDDYSKLVDNWCVNVSKTENIITVRDEDHDICLLKAELQF